MFSLIGEERAAKETPKFCVRSFQLGALAALLACIAIALITEI